MKNIMRKLLCIDPRLPQEETRIQKPSLELKYRFISPDVTCVVTPSTPPLTKPPTVEIKLPRFETNHQVEDVTPQVRLTSILDDISTQGYAKLGTIQNFLQLTKSLKYHQEHTYDFFEKPVFKESPHKIPFTSLLFEDILKETGLNLLKYKDPILKEIIPLKTQQVFLQRDHSFAQIHQDYLGFHILINMKSDQKFTEVIDKKSEQKFLKIAQQVFDQIRYSDEYLKNIGLENVTLKKLGFTLDNIFSTHHKEYLEARNIFLNQLTEKIFNLPEHEKILKPIDRLTNSKNTDENAAEIIIFAGAQIKDICMPSGVLVRDIFPHIKPLKHTTPKNAENGRILASFALHL